MRQGRARDGSAKVKTADSKGDGGSRERDGNEKQGVPER